jgi:GNAT superfamily N-acetyltransferase
MEVTIRSIREADISECGRIIYEAFKTIEEAHNFQVDFPNVETAQGFARGFVTHPSIYGVASELEGRFVGSNFLDERGPVRGVGPLTVDPTVQNKGIGGKLMKAVIERGAGSKSIRLLQETFNMRSMSLYASLGFDVVEPIVMMTGRPQSRPSGAVEVRPMNEHDLEGCEDLCLRVHKFERTNELADALKVFNPYVAIRSGRIVGYASAPTHPLAGHGIAESDEDMASLLGGVAALVKEPLWVLLPVRQARLHRWCLAQKMHAVKPLTVMSMGEYHEPSGPWFPSILY